MHQISPVMFKVVNGMVISIILIGFPRIHMILNSNE